MTKLTRACHQEVHELHEFFEGWFRGALETETFDRLESALAPEFVLVGPEGSRRPRDPVLGRIRRGRGSRPTLAIRIQNVTVVFAAGKYCLLTYEEWQDASGEETTGCITTALFRLAREAPNGVVWVHAHETWIGDD